MIFDLHYWPMALIFSALSAILAFWFVGKPEGASRLSSNSKEREGKNSNLPTAFSGAIITFIVDLLIQRFWLYYGQPSFTGSFFGYSSMIFLAAAPAVVIGSLLSGGRAIARSALIMAVLFLVPLFQGAYFSFGPNNSRAFAQLPHISVAGPDETIPPTFEQRMVRVTESMAAQKAQTALSQKGNYSTIYKVGQLTLQGIKGHRYYAAPMVPNNSVDVFWTPLLGGRSESPASSLSTPRTPVPRAKCMMASISRSLKMSRGI
jgi:hypothetical protein